MNIRNNLTPRGIAKALEITVEDLKGSYQNATATTIENDIAKIRLSSLYDSIKRNPSLDLESHVLSVGMKLDNKTRSLFEDEFWLSIDEHQEHAMRFNRCTTRKDSPATYG